MKEDQEPLVEVVLRREISRLEGRRLALEVAFKGLVSRFSGAEKLRPEIEAVGRSDRLFLDRVRAADFDDWGKTLRAEFFEMLALEESEFERVELAFRDQAFVLVSGKGNRERAKGTSEAGEANKQKIGGGLMERLLESEKPPEMVSYPIIFTHEGEENQQAIAASILWAVMAEVVGEGPAQADQKGREVILRGEGMVLQLKEAAKVAGDQIPGADRFGFVERGEIFRRLEEFHRTDPEAHWDHWIGNEEPGQRREEYALREQGGALLHLEVEPKIGRVRERKRKRTEVIRKRMNLFVEEPTVATRDRYFSSSALLIEGLKSSLEEWVREGFRIVFLEREGEESRGRRPV